MVADPTTIYEESRRLAEATGGHYMDQFTYAERATDWRGNNNIAESIFQQMSEERHPVPTWIVVGAGTGGTSATIGRYRRYRRLASRVCVVDPENSVYARCFASRDRTLRCEVSSRIEGIGRPRVEPSFLPEVIDRVIEVPDAASIAGIRFLERWLGRRCGGSTGTNLVGCLTLAGEMAAAGQSGSIVTLLCDPGERYRDTYYDDAWLARAGLRIEPHLEALERSFTGRA